MSWNWIKNNDEVLQGRPCPFCLQMAGFVRTKIVTFNMVFNEKGDLVNRIESGVITRKARYCANCMRIMPRNVFHLKYKSKKGGRRWGHWNDEKRKSDDALAKREESIVLANTQMGIQSPEEPEEREGGMACACGHSLDDHDDEIGACLVLSCDCPGFSHDESEQNEQRQEEEKEDSEHESQS